MSSLQGKLLVATRHLKDPNFFRTVVLMLENSDESSMGLVINRPSSLSLDAAFSQAKKSTLCTDSIHSGGPVETTALFILHNCSHMSAGEEAVSEGIYLTGSNDTFEDLIDPTGGCTDECRFRVYCGYAGWGEGQLEDEIDRGDWMVLPAESSMVFIDDPFDVWDNCMDRIRETTRILPDPVAPPEWN